MRVLFTCRPGYGHYYPLVPLARAAAAAGHAVAVATGEPIRGVAEADGFEAFSAGPGFAAIREAFVAKFGPLDEIPREQHRSFSSGACLPASSYRPVCRNCSPSTTSGSRT